MASKRRRHHSHKRKNPIRRAVIDLCVLVLVAGAGYVGYTFYHNHKTQENNAKLQTMYRGESEDKQGASIAEDQLARLNQLREDYGMGTVRPTATPEATEAPATEAPTEETIEIPTVEPTDVPTDAPTETPLPLVARSVTETEQDAPTTEPTEQPTDAPTDEPTEAPTHEPTETPTEAPTEAPTQTPTEAPTDEPTEAPTEAPTEEPTEAPTDEPTEAPTESPEPAPTEEPGPRLNDSFTELYATNPDVIGWITTGGNVDYPVVWREDDNDFYLNHDFNGDKDIVGTIFLDTRNAPDFSDDLLLIYGHNMRSGSMFGDLNSYRDVDYLTAHPIVTLQNAYEEEPRQYVLFSLFDASMNADDRNYFAITYFNFANDAERQSYLDALAARSMYAVPPIAVDTNDQLVTLVTCSYSNENGRFLLTGRALRDGETEESILEKYKGWKGN